MAAGTRALVLWKLAALPWTWSALGCVLGVLALAWPTSATSRAELFRLALVFLAPLCAGVGVVIRFQSSEDNTWAPVSALRFVLALLFALLAMALTFVLVASWTDAPWLWDVKAGMTTILWFLAAPLAVRTGWDCLQRIRRSEPASRLEEAAALLLVLAVSCLLARFALPFRWTTLHLFFWVAFWAALVGAPLAAADQHVRRVVASGILLYHLGGILAAVLALPPSPWIADQIWTRLYRPYLEFMYLNNAYHFYAPEPGPACYLWFRLQLVDEKGELHGDWFKVPNLDDAGRPQHGMALAYQRMLSVTENTQPKETVNADSPEAQEKVERRRAWTPEGAEKPQVVGVPRAKPEEAIPLHPSYGPLAQLHVPVRDVRFLIESYVRHVAHLARDLYPDMKLQKIRLYRVIHHIPPANLYLRGWSPNDPQFYMPIYFGDYDVAGNLLNPNDPLLYWVLPIFRDPPYRVDSPIRDWARKHAGDPKWIRVTFPDGFTEWREEKK